MRLLESSMHDALLTVLNKSAVNDTNVRIADILNRMEHEIIDGILSNIEEVRPDTAKALKRLMFRFDDIGKLNAKARMTIFDQVPAEQVVLALRGTDDTFRELVLSSIASRARRMVESELQSSDEPDPKAVNEARRSIADRVMELIGKGEIDINVSENPQP
jgi:flagellar motor switch protein FliG